MQSAVWLVTQGSLSNKSSGAIYSDGYFLSLVIAPFFFSPPGKRHTRTHLSCVLLCSCLCRSLLLAGHLGYHCPGIQGRYLPLGTLHVCVGMTFIIVRVDDLMLLYLEVSCYLVFLGILSSIVTDNFLIKVILRHLKLPDMEGSHKQCREVLQKKKTNLAQLLSQLLLVFFRNNGFWI